MPYHAIAWDTRTRLINALAPLRFTSLKPLLQTAVVVPFIRRSIAAQFQWIVFLDP